jgi:phenylpropionate dioxygenase-like ring-hydroxylating dioxygenase large terminal subunit
VRRRGGRTTAWVLLRKGWPHGRLVQNEPAAGGIADRPGLGERWSMRDTSLEDFLSRSEIEALYRPVEEATGLPGRAYGPEFYALEQRRLFPRVWCPVGFASDVPDPGDTMPVDLAGWPLVLVRSRDREIRAFHNICRHRGMRVVIEPGRRTPALVCPWHTWAYDLEGRLLGRPQFAGEGASVDNPGARERLPLKPVRVGRWVDLVFVNIDGNAPPFEEHIRPLAEFVSSYDLSRVRRADGWSLEYPGNWKVSVEGAIEDYHLPYVHPQIMKGVRQANARTHAVPGCFMATSAARDAGDRTEATTTAFAAGLPPLLRPGAEARTQFIGIFPTGMTQTRANHLLQGLLLPDGPERTRVVMNHYYAGEAATDPALQDARQALLEEWKLVFEQDRPFVRGVHENYRRRDDAGIASCFSPFWDSAILQFQRSVVETLGT